MLRRNLTQLALFAVVMGFSASVMAQPIPAEEIKMSKILEVFKNAALNASLDGDTVMVKEGDYKVLVSLDAPKNLLTYVLIFGFKEGTPQSERIQLANKLNYAIVFTRFYVSDDGMLWADYNISYEEGLTPAQIVRAYRWIHKTVSGGLLAHDEKGIVR